MRNIYGSCSSHYVIFIILLLDDRADYIHTVRRSVGWESKSKKRTEVDGVRVSGGVYCL